ncbi:hypothetical protein Sa4125_25570 [Aureimonas sp. SA4125]|uniref:hypothetical protein n=1 Tax=Aureimonas sp. SA4125 TaxID=2826993 RepID=UPI001CC3F3F0|nr:hypothetical protein [Aureimonas sp. SA4125]BDA85015.1 hypothetical protein Sa4125_25570 [Aureimonas sp. SA4125]
MANSPTLKPEIQVPAHRSHEIKDDQPFERFNSYGGVELEIHAQDRDRNAIGWAAIPRGVSEKRLKMRLMEPVSASDIWNRDVVRADITVISELTSQGFEPVEIHLTRIDV